MKKNKIVLISGVSGGIGYATAKAFKEKDWNVVGIDKEEVKDEANAIDYFLKYDLSKSKNIDKIYNEFKEKYSSLDCLVNNAALQISKSILNTKEEDWDQVFEINVKSVFLISKKFHDLLSKANGSIVNVSSVHAKSTSKGLSAYASSKGALLTFTKSAALEFAEDGINVNAILPGAIDTQMLRDGLNREHSSGKNIEKKIENLGKKHAMNRVGEPKEIAEAILFLGRNDDSSFMTGQTIIVDGGALSQLSTET